MNLIAMKHLFVAAAILSTSSSYAQTPTSLSATTAQSIIQGCVEHAAKKRQSHAIAVVDGSGSLITFLRMDRNSPGVADFALLKARAVAHWQFSTEGMAKAAESTPGFGNVPGTVTVAGGVPIFSADGRTFLGAVGVSGESPQDDKTCGTAGILAAGFSDTRK